MQFQNQIVPEIIAPNNVVFQPGNNVTGFGSTVPDELMAAGFPNAIVFYASDWNPTNTTQTIKFRFIAANAQGLQLGFGYCANPSVSQVATVVVSQTLSTLNFIDNNSNVIFRNLAGQMTAQFNNLAGEPSLFLYDPSGNRVVALNDLGSDASSIVLGTNPGVTLTHVAGGTQWITDSHIVHDTADNTFTFANGWFDQRLARYRLMSDGTVQFRGVIFKNTNPANGEVMITGLPAAYRPAQPANFLCPCSARGYNGTQKVEVETDGTVKIWDPAANTGDVCLDPIRYPVIT